MARPDEAAARAVREALRAAGVDDDETRPDALLPLAGRTLELDRAIVERLAREPSAERADALRALATAAERRGWKAAAKEARRALYRFAQRGVAVPAAPAPERAARPLATLEGYVSAIDGRGDRLLWLVRPQRDGGLVVLTAVLNEPAGLRDVAVAELGRKALRRMERDLEARHHLRLVPADGRYCDALLAEGFARARAADTPGVGEYPTYRARLVSSEPPAPDEPLIARVLDLEALPVVELAQRGGVLLDEPEFTTWMLERTTIAPYLEEIAAARETTLVLSRALQEERVHGVAARALRELFAGAGAATYRRRLEEMAYYLHATSRAELAKVAAASARALASSTAGGEGIAFFEQLVRRSFAAYLSEDEARARAAAESSLLVRPAAAPASAPSPRRAR